MHHKMSSVVGCLGLLILLLILAACDQRYQINPLGYNYVASQLATPTPKASIPVPTVIPPKSAPPNLKMAGMGNTLDTFLKHAGTLLSISHPPAQYVFQTTLDIWPGGSILIVNFENGKEDLIPRAIQFSFVPGTNHPTTYEQAQALAEALLPSDITGPVVVNQQNQDQRVCLSKSYSSTTLAQLFPPQDFVGVNGKLAKPGDVIVSFFPNLKQSGVYNEPQSDTSGNDQIDNANTIGSVLIALGDRPAC